MVLDMPMRPVSLLRCLRVRFFRGRLAKQATMICARDCYLNGTGQGSKTVIDHYLLIIASLAKGLTIRFVQLLALRRA